MVFQGPFTNLPLFHPDFLKWCSMHCVNLGIDLLTIGSTFRYLLDSTDTWQSDDGDLDDEARLLSAFAEFKSWSKANKVVYLDEL